MASFGELLAELRQDRAMTQKQLAEILFVSVGTISNYEKGKHLPDVDRLIMIADYFNVTTDYLLGRSPFNLSPDVFSERIADHKTVGSIISDLKALPRDRQRILTTIINDMRLSMLLDEISHKENT